MALPLVDLAASRDAGTRIDAGLAEYGFLQLANIGIDAEELDAAFATAEAFFHGPVDAKQRCAYRSAVENYGYQGVLEENLDPTAPADIKQSFTMRDIVHNPPPAERWPSEEFRTVMTRLFANALASAHAIQREMALALGMPEDFFTRTHSGQCCSLRLLHYPSTGVPEAAPEQMGAGAHTDYGFITLLFQHGVGGLQVIDSSGAWIDVEPRDDAVVVNSGDLLEHWTNGKYKSTVHRVMPKAGDRDRLSIAFFVDPDSDTEVEVLESCISADNPARFGPTIAGAHLTAKLSATHQGRFAV